MSQKKILFWVVIWLLTMLWFHYFVSLVPRHPIFRACHAALSKNRIWTRSLVKLGLNHMSVLACCRTNQIAQVK